MTDKSMKRGDIVRLKSGGPKMTVRMEAFRSYDAVVWRCDWFLRSGEFRQQDFAAEELEPAR